MDQLKLILLFIQILISFCLCQSSEIKHMENVEKQRCQCTYVEKEPGIRPQELEPIKPELKKTTRLKRQISGREVEQDPNDPKYKQLAEESKQKYIEENNIRIPYKILSINKVTTQIVSGIITKIDFVISPESATGNAYKCISTILETPWLKFKDVKVDCYINYPLNRQNINEMSSMFTGGGMEQDVNDPHYRVLAEEAMEKYLTENRIKNPHKIAFVTRVTTQLVAGEMTRIDFVMTPVSGRGHERHCRSAIWEKTWMNFKQIDVSCDLANQHSRLKRKNPGGEVERNPNNPKYKHLAEKSKQKYIKENNINIPYKISSINKVQVQQVMTGTMTKIDFVITPESVPGDTYECKSTILETPWFPSNDIKVDCHINYPLNRKNNNVMSTMFTGGEMEQDVNDPHYKVLAEEAMQKYLNENRIVIPYKISFVTRVTTQVVAGVITRIDFVMTPASGRGHQRRCRSSIWEKPWLNFKQIDVNCH